MSYNKNLSEERIKVIEEQKYLVTECVSHLLSVHERTGDHGKELVRWHPAGNNDQRLLMTDMIKAGIRDGKFTRRQFRKALIRRLMILAGYDHAQSILTGLENDLYGSKTSKYNANMRQMMLIIRKKTARYTTKEYRAVRKAIYDRENEHRTSRPWPF